MGVGLDVGRIEIKMDQRSGLWGDIRVNDGLQASQLVSLVTDDLVHIAFLRDAFRTVEGCLAIFDL